MNRGAWMCIGVGMVLWLLSWVVLSVGYIERLLLFAFFVTVPLALLITKSRSRYGKTSQLYRTIRRLHIPLAVLGALSFVYPAGPIAGLLSLGWLLFTCIVGWYGLLRFLERGFYFLEEFCIDAGLMYMMLGGFWFTAQRFGLNIMHFGSLIILLTAIHFHFSSLSVPICSGLVGRMVEKGRLYRFMAIGNTISPLLIAVGITYSRTMEWLAVLFFACCIMIYVYYTFALTRSIHASRYAKALLLLSSLSLLFTIGFAIAYGVGRGFGMEVVSIPTMVLVHGTGNAFGFVFLGFLAWAYIHPEARFPASSIPHSRMRGRGRIGADFLERNGWIDSSRAQCTGLVDDFSVYESRFFHIARLNSRIQHFYEHTLAYELEAWVRWLNMFGILSRVYKPLAERMEQLNLPLNHTDGPVVMDGRIVPVHSARDGRENVRAWVRTDKKTGTAVFVAVYSSHTDQEERYMNIALPLPFGNMTGILRVRHDKSDGLILTSVPRAEGGGDEGIYYAVAGMLFRLPLNETFHVRADQEGKLYAEHRMWLFGIPFLFLSYMITSNASFFECR